MKDYFVDYHLHTDHSPDSSMTVATVMDQARQLGLREVCITDHIEVDTTNGLAWQSTPASVQAQLAEVSRAHATSQGFVKRGLELGLPDHDPGTVEDLFNLIDPANYDFLIASLHQVDGLGPFDPPFFAGRTLGETAHFYMASLNERLRTLPLTHFDAVGHIDFISKGCHGFSDPRLSLDDFVEPLTDLFTYLIENGKTLEVNTSVYRRFPGGAVHGLNWLRLFARLGGDFVTIGSDAHSPGHIGYRLDDAIDLVRAAGIRYIATYDRHEPHLHAVT